MNLFSKQVDLEVHNEKERREPIFNLETRAI